MGGGHSCIVRYYSSLLVLLKDRRGVSFIGLIGGPATTFFGWGGIKLRLRLRFIPPHPKKGGAPYRSSKGTALGRDGGPRWFSGAGAYVRMCGTLACELEYEVCSGRRLLRMLGFCIRIVTYLWEITRIPLE